MHLCLLIFDAKISFLFLISLLDQETSFEKGGIGDELKEPESVDCEESLFRFSSNSLHTSSLFSTSLDLKI